MCGNTGFQGLGCLEIWGGEVGGRRVQGACP